MARIPSIIPPISSAANRPNSRPKSRNDINSEPPNRQNSQDMEALRTQFSVLLAETNSTDPWTSRARPAFLYVMYALILWALPIGLIAAVRPDVALAIGKGMTSYLTALPEPLYALFGTGYLGYTAARTWGKVKGVEK